MLCNDVRKKRNHTPPKFYKGRPSSLLFLLMQMQTKSTTNITGLISVMIAITVIDVLLVLFEISRKNKEQW